jgi:flagellar hook protein FlgE
MPNSLLTGITGLVAHQRRLDVVANNLANMNSVAFKSHRALFSDLLYETVQPATNGSAIAIGGTNPNQIGSGVKTVQISKKMGQGNLEATGQPFDFAIQGEGFFVVSNGTEKQFTRAGAFSLDERGNLVDPATGYFVQRSGTLGEGDATNPPFQKAGDNKINVPLGMNMLGKETGLITLKGNLQGNALGPQAEILTTSKAFLASGIAATGSTLLNDLDSNTVDYVAGDMITLSGTNTDGSSFSTTLSVDGSTTINDVLAAINSIATDAVATINSSGNLVFSANADGPAELTLKIDDDAGNTGGTSFSSHRLIETTAGKDGDTFQTSAQMYDAQGGLHVVAFHFVKKDTNLWDATLKIDGTEGSVLDGQINDIRFADDGSFLSAGSSGIGDTGVELQFNGVSQSQVMEIDLSTLTQTATQFDLVSEQNGRPAGKLAGIQVTADGVIQGVSTNGDRVPIAQIGIAVFRNVYGLNSVGSNYYKESLNSGEAQIGAGGSSGRGTLAGGHLELSNVDMALEFTQLIVAQRGFSANARTITVANEMLQELTNVIR